MSIGLETTETNRSSATAIEDGWLTQGRFAGILAILVFATFIDIFTGANTFFVRDFAPLGVPYATYHNDSFWRGEIPLWNPLSNCGVPFVAQWCTMVFYPPSLFYLLFPLPWSLSVFCIGHLYLGGLGMYWLAHRWTGSRLGAALAGLIYVFNGLALNGLMWAAITAAMGLLPWVVGLVEDAWKHGGRRILPAVLVASLQMLTGAPEHILMTWILLTAFGVLQACLNLAQARVIALRFVLVVILVTAVCAVQLFPFLDMLRQSQRDSTFGGSSWAMPGWGWASFLIPLYFSFKTNMGSYWQPAQFMVATYYLGIGTVLLSITAVLLVRNARVWLISAISLVCLILALGDEGLLFSWLREIAPGLGYMRYPVKFVYPISFLAPLLVAFAVARCCGETADLRRTFRRVLGFVAAGLLGLMAALIWFAWNYPQRLPAARDWPVTWESGWTRAVALIVVVTMLLALGGAVRRQMQWCITGLLLIVFWLDLLTHSSALHPTLPTLAFQKGIMKFEPTPELGLRRVMNHPLGAKRAQAHIRKDAAEDFISRRFELFANLNLLEDVPKFGGIQSLFLREMEEFEKIVNRSPPEQLSRFADFLAASHMSSSERFEWLPRATMRPMVTAGHRPVFLDRKDTLARLAQTDLDLERTVLMPLSAKGLVHVTSNTTARAITRKASAHRWDIEVEAEAPSLVVIAQAYYHPWVATVNGERVPLMRANHAFQAVEVPAGHSELVLAYKDRAFFAGAVVSAASLGGLGLAAWRPRRRTALPEPEPEAGAGSDIGGGTPAGGKETS